MLIDQIRRSSALLRPLTVAALLLGLGMAQAQAPQPEEIIYPRRPAAKARVKPAAVKPAAVAPAVPASAPAPSSGTRCGEDDALSGRAADPGGSAMPAASNADPRGQMQQLVQMAMNRSLALGASTLLAQAARDDWEEARAARLPVINLGGTFGAAANKTAGYPFSKGQLTNMNLSIGAPIYDAGRTELLAGWRSQLAETARQGLINSEQQLALQTVSLAMDRSRYQLQIQVYGQYVRKMACLVEALETITQADRGRASELVQAQKNRQQAELAVDQTKTALRQTEIRLRRFVGDELPPSASFSALLTTVPGLAEMQADVLEAAEVNQLGAQAKAQARFAEAVKAGTRPQVNLLINGTGSAGLSKSAEVVAGVTVNIPLYNPSADSAIAAASKRAEAARLQRDDAIEGRRYRVADMHEAATSSFDRARSIVEILRSSDRLRASTLLQWQQLGRRSLFDVMGTEADYYGMRIAHINAIYDGQQAVALLWSLGRGVMTPLR